MCGIAGYIGRTHLPAENIEFALKTMARRGPDVQTSQKFSFSGQEAVFLHSRLSIIDLEERSHQPFQSGDHVLTFNGEIYNYLELKSELEGAGVVFRTRSDTEVLLESYRHWGEKCVEKFEGMWSLAIYDKKSGTTFLSRDRFGEKPLYLYHAHQGVFFASEVKTIQALSGDTLKVNKRQLQRYLVNGYKSLYKSNETFYEGIYDLTLSTNLYLAPHSTPIEKKYWHPKVNQLGMTTEEAVQGIRLRLIESVRLRTRADVPLAFCLSGGIDSSSLVSIASKIHKQNVSTFSIIDPDPRYNEKELIEHTVKDLNCKHTNIVLKKEPSLDRLKNLIKYHDAPVATISYLVHSMLSEQISAQGFRISISGTAADELFTGYYDHFNLHLFEMRNQPEFLEAVADWERLVKPVVRNPFLGNPRLFIENPDFRDHIYLKNDLYASYLTDSFHEPFKEMKLTDSLLRNRMLNELFYEATRVILHEDDLNSMFYSVENRSPYLDTHLFDFAYSIPSELLIQKGTGKYLLREAMKGILNDKVRLNNQKKGFNASIKSVFDLSSQTLRKILLEDSPIFNVVKKSAIENLSESQHFANSDSKFLFNFINAKLFLELNP